MKKTTILMALVLFAFFISAVLTIFIFFAIHAFKSVAKNTNIPRAVLKEFHKIRPDDIFGTPSDIEFAQAVIEGNVLKVKQLIDGGANVNAKGKINITPLYLAFHYQQPEVFKLLLENKADPTIKIDESDRKQLRWYEIIDPDLLICAANDLDPTYIVALLEKGYCSYDAFKFLFGVDQGYLRRRWKTKEEFGAYPSPQVLSRISEIKLDAFLKAGVEFKRNGKDSVLNAIFDSSFGEIVGGKKCFYSCAIKLLDLKIPITIQFLNQVLYLRNNPSLLESQGQEAVEDFAKVCNILLSVYPDLNQDFDEIMSIRKEMHNVPQEEKKTYSERIDAIFNNIVEKYNASIEKEE